MTTPHTRTISRGGRQTRGRHPRRARQVPRHAAARSRQRRLMRAVTMAVSGVLPRTIQLCAHCQQRPAGFWARRTGDAVVRRPWCLLCRQDLDRDRYDVIPFGG